MKTALQTLAKNQAQPTAAQWSASLVQQRCACGMSAGLDGQCGGCRRQALVGYGPVLVQPKLKIGRPDDKYEQEADRVADNLTLAESVGFHYNNSHLHKNSTSAIQPRVILRIGKNDFSESKDLDGLNPVHTGSRSVIPAGKGKDFFHALKTLDGTGKALPHKTRNFFENYFNADFGSVRVHAGNRADALANSVNAEAFTFGRNIIIGRGAYRPETQSGRKLLAHELAHVVQQKDAHGYSLPCNSENNATKAFLPIQRKSKTLKSKAFDNQIDRDYNEIVAILDERHYSDSDEEYVINKLRFWAKKGIAPNGRPYLDSLLAKLTLKRKTVGLVIHQETNYYSLIFNHFDRVEEVRQIVDNYASDTFQGDKGLEEASLLKEFGRSKENLGWFWQKQFEEIGRSLKQDGVPSIIQNLLGGAVGVLEGFADLMADAIEGVWSTIEALEHLRDSILYLLMSGLQRTGLKFLQRLPVVGYIFNPLTFKPKFEKTLSFFISAKDALQNPTLIFNSIKDSAEKAWNELLEEYNSADDFNKSRIIAKGVVKIGMAVGGFIKNLPKLSKKITDVGHKIQKLMSRIVKRIKKMATEVFSEMRFKRFEVETKGDWLRLYGIRSKIFLAAFFIPDFKESILGEPDAKIKKKILARASIKGRAKVAAEKGDVERAGRLRGGTMSRLSESIGELATDSAVKKRFPDAKRIFPKNIDSDGPTGAYKLDMIYQKSDGNVIVVEAKGGKGKIGQSETLHAAGKKKKSTEFLASEQGTSEYLETKLVQMMSLGGSEAEAASKALEALVDGKLRYFLSKTKISSSPAEPLSVILKEFDLYV